MTGAALLAALLAAADGAPPARAEPLSVLARAERTAARLGEPFDYELEVRHRPDEAYELAGDLDAPPFRGRALGCRRTEAGGEARTRCTLSLVVLDLGAHDVPDVSLKVATARGEATLAVAGPRITGVGIIAPDAPAESLALRGLAPPVPVLVRSWRLVWWALGVAAAVALLAALARRARRGPRIAGAPAAPAESPAVRLARRLDELEAEALPRRGKAREHVFALSTIVREWVGAMAGLNALELTTDELCERLARRPVAGIDPAGLRRFLEAADLVKYAREPVTEDECRAAVGWARNLPARATPTPTPTPTPTSTSTSTSTPTSTRRS